MRLTIGCPVGKEPITIDAMILTTGSASYQPPHFCPTCRVSYSVPQLRAMEADTDLQIAEYERSWQMLDGYEGDENGFPLEAA